jgi:predicted nucleotidyltransferase
MHTHHGQSIQNATEYFQRDPEVQALLLSGSIAHGFEAFTSDVDLMIFVSEEDYQRRFQTGQLHFFNTDLCTYKGGYVDGKYLSLNFVKQVLEKGGDPARFAFEGSRVLFSRVDSFAEISAKLPNIRSPRRRTDQALMPSSKPGTSGEAQAGQSHCKYGCQQIDSLADA